MKNLTYNLKHISYKLQFEYGESFTLSMNIDRMDEEFRKNGSRIAVHGCGEIITVMSENYPQFGGSNLFLLGDSKTRVECNKRFRTYGEMERYSGDVISAIEHWDNHMETVNPIDIKKTEEILMSWC